MSALLRVRYVSWADDTGYGVAGKALLRTAMDAGVPMRWDALAPRGRMRIGPAGYYRRLLPDEVADGDLAPLAACDQPCSHAIIHTPADYFPHWRRQLGAIPTLGYTAWETDRLPARWSACLAAVDGVLVPSIWCRERFRASGVAGPVSVVPHVSQLDQIAASDRALARDRLAADLSIPPGTFVFLALGEWTRRKGVDLLLDAWASAFGPGDPVALVLATSRYARRRSSRLLKPGPETRDLLARWQRGRRTAPVRLLTSSLTPTLVAGLHDLSDCYVSLSRGEGFGLGAFEAARSDRPVLMTGWGGQTDFLPGDLADLLSWRFAAVDDPSPEGVYTPDQQWAIPDVDEAVERLRSIASDPEAARARGARLGAWVRARFTPEASLDALTQALP